MKERDLETTVAAIEKLVRENGMAHFLAAAALFSRREADHWMRSMDLASLDVWLGLYARLRTMYENTPKSWPKPDSFQWY